jgi:hypothetical protein
VTVTYSVNQLAGPTVNGEIRDGRIYVVFAHRGRIEPAYRSIFPAMHDTKVDVFSDRITVRGSSQGEPLECVFVLRVPRYARCGHDPPFAAAPVVQHGDVLLPIRAFFVPFGATVDWDQPARHGIVSVNHLSIVVTSAPSSVPTAMPTSAPTRTAKTPAPKSTATTKPTPRRTPSSKRTSTPNKGGVPCSCTTASPQPGSVGTTPSSPPNPFLIGGEGSIITAPAPAPHKPKDYRAVMIDLIAFTALLALVFLATTLGLGPAPRSAPAGRVVSSAQALYWVRRLSLAIVAAVVLVQFLVLGTNSDPNAWTAGMAELGPASLQWYCSIVVLFLVAAVVATGIYMSMHQFAIWAEEKRGFLESAKGVGTPEEARNLLEISAGGISIATPFFGIVVLVISLAFFYFFVMLLKGTPLPTASPAISVPAQTAAPSIRGKTTH